VNVYEVTLPAAVGPKSGSASAAEGHHVADLVMEILLADETVTDPVVTSDAAEGTFEFSVEVGALSAMEALAVAAGAVERAMRAAGLVPAEEVAGVRSELLAVAS